jgi:ubiquinone/menaquinone biosynthesis C-methylase UbiE
MDCVYNEIAVEFSRTRYKVWPKVANFLDSLHPSSHVLEIGCGNGKNMLYRPDLSMKGLDITEGFLEICRDRGLRVEYGDARKLPEPTNAYDAVLSIAVIHHLQTRAERRQALQEIARVLKPGGQALLSVWAHTEDSQDNNQDRLIPFKTPTTTVQRFYHFYTKKELQEDLEESVGNTCVTWTIQEERGNWYAVLKKAKAKA